MAASKDRRGKTDAAAAAAPATKKSSSSSLSAQLDRATETLHKNAAQIARLHGQWRSYLTLLSYLVVLLSFHQFQSISSACLYDIKAWNQHHDGAAAANEQPADDPRIVSGAQAVTLVLRDAAAVVLGIVMASLLCAWLQKATGEATADLTHPLYRTAQSCVLPVLGILYYQTFHKPTNTCLEDLLLRDDDEQQPTLPEGLELPSATTKPKSAAGFPVVLVFHVIVTACVWFMNKQRTKLLQSELAVQELRDELQQAAETKKKK